MHLDSSLTSLFNAVEDEAKQMPLPAISAASSPWEPKEIKAMKPCDRNIKSTLQLIEKMIQLANLGDAEREDTGCGILYGVLRDSAYKLRKLAIEEREKHIQKGWWNET
jgi:phosphopantothenoylcysteine synthetase/decarboxylase